MGRHDRESKSRCRLTTGATWIHCEKKRSKIARFDPPGCANYAVLGTCSSPWLPSRPPLRTLLTRRRCYGIALRSKLDTSLIRVQASTAQPTSKSSAPPTKVQLHAFAARRASLVSSTQVARDLAPMYHGLAAPKLPHRHRAGARTEVADQAASSRCPCQWETTAAV